MVAISALTETTAPDHNDNWIPITVGSTTFKVDPRQLLGGGRADYADSTYTSGSPFSLSANTDTLLPNDGVNGPKTYEPPGFTLYSSGKIRGKEGDALTITVEFKSEPTNQTATNLEIWFDIGGSVGELYRRITTFPKGAGVVRNIVNTTLVYTLDTWEANGAEVYVRSNGPVDIYNIRYVIARTFKAHD